MEADDCKAPAGAERSDCGGKSLRYQRREEELGIVRRLDTDTERKTKGALLILTNLFKLSQLVVYGDAQGLRPHLTCESKRLTRGITSPNPCTLHCTWKVRVAG